MVKLKITKNIFFFKGGAKQFDSEIASKFYNYKQMTSNYGSLFPLLNKKNIAVIANLYLAILTFFLRTVWYKLTIMSYKVRNARNLQLQEKKPEL